MSEESNNAVEVAASQVTGLSLEKKPKQRKAQTEEEFLEQKAEYEATGPQIHTQEWLYDVSLLNSLDNSKKLDRVHILHACERAYYLKDYQKCLSLIDRGEKLFGVQLDDDESNLDLKADFASSGKKTKKSSKVERHVIELLHIKEACVRKMASATI
ncbi:hypothetical protein EJF18_20564 [Clavispora lusitaniae]|uniref:Uncharacterized protein n=2 Tax=Clavispora lusitaniae TaxID=36911 RepID=C4Y0P9_CLAL4|nr:uncharacterized protein CLUG_01781 [Clavispora lusitaniae ATCC 42720]QFZ26652.1 hypothetical protein EJF14_20564 [Clavispora lusitaniae]EEQ37658.1 hypothetical protein CLUG_01781 [Clavispora lusitaniae ATCC 42720]QFZ32320.1 hypothetical protein EJF16_20564 [Clavispora lusitaniae]QFZ37989.1 hypothetical protein EJF15_20564 [Clavispora lusitaniae]QFZ43672.1 hypothetical protein EJF18_20564 [Clavispora lusitaniae]